MDIKEEDKKLSAQFPDRPKWRRAGARACHRCIRGAPSQGQPKWWRAGRGGRSSLKEGSQMCHECERREQRIVLSPRTGLNGGERGQEQVRKAKKQKEEIENPSQDQPKWWRSGPVNLFGPYLCLCPCLYGHLCPCPYSCLSFPLWGQCPYLFVGQR